MKKLPNVNDMSSSIIKIDFLDEARTPITPTAVTWTLLDGSNVVINSRSNVVFPVLDLGPTIYITLGENDTKFSDGATRKFIIRAEYVSSLTSENMVLTDIGTFTIIDIPSIGLV